MIGADGSAGGALGRTTGLLRIDLAFIGGLAAEFDNAAVGRLEDARAFPLRSATYSCGLHQMRE